MFSAVIPTLRHPAYLQGLLGVLEAHDAVDEILIINNGAAPLPWTSPKTRVLQQEHNIFVNPAWNLRVKEAKSSHVLVLNDDIAIPSALVSSMARVHKSLRPGLVCPAPTSFRRPRDGIVSITPSYHRTWGMGVVMSVAREDWVAVPEELQIFFGDDWQFYSQAKRNMIIHGYRIETLMSVTSAAPEMMSRSRMEREYFSGHKPATYETKFAREIAI